ncbi:MAG: hypothetical protein HY827_10240, partial [Actinobacteria bacterium]|nr:hypothetical protein [Actinomycetota bacterium]
MALIPPHFVESVVTFERTELGSGGEDAFVPVASGVLVGTHLGPGIKEEETHYQVWAVTAQHVLQDDDTLYLKLNSKTGAMHFPLGSLEVGNWATYGAFDVAIAPINARKLRDDGVDWQYRSALAQVCRSDLAHPPQWFVLREQVLHDRPRRGRSSVQLTATP